MEAPIKKPTPPLIVWMSFQLAIPWRVALQHGPPPLHQPESTMLHVQPKSGDDSFGDFWRKERKTHSNDLGL